MRAPCMEAFRSRTQYLARNISCHAIVLGEASLDESLSEEARDHKCSRIFEWNIGKGMKKKIGVIHFGLRSDRVAF